MLIFKRNFNITKSKEVPHILNTIRVVTRSDPQKIWKKLYRPRGLYRRLHGWPKKVSHYHESSLNRIYIKARFFINFDYKIAREYNKYALHILCVSDVINCCVWTCDTGSKINASNKIMFENQKKRKYGNKRCFYINSHLKVRLDIEFTAC